MSPIIPPLQHRLPESEVKAIGNVLSAHMAIYESWIGAGGKRPVAAGRFSEAPLSGSSVERSHGAAAYRTASPLPPFAGQLA